MTYREEQTFISFMILKSLILISFSLLYFIHLGCIPISKKETVDTDTIILRNQKSPLEITIHPTIGNLISQIHFQKQEILYSPYITENNSPGKMLEGIPFLFPFANRIEEDFIPISKNMHSIPAETKYLRRDKNGLLLHGYLYYQNGWEVESVRNLDSKSYYKSKFIFEGEFLAAFPFPSQIRQEFELDGNSLTITVIITNTGKEQIPLSFGFHPYFRAPLEWRKFGKLYTNAQKVYEADKQLLPTGKLNLSGSILKNIALSEMALDHNFIDFPKAQVPYSELSLPGLRIRMELLEGFDHILLFTPSNKDFVCMEPMFGSVNAFFLHKKGLYPNLRFVSPGKQIKASFRLTFYNNSQIPRSH